MKDKTMAVLPEITIKLDERFEVLIKEASDLIRSHKEEHERLIKVLESIPELEGYDFRGLRNRGE